MAKKDWIQSLSGKQLKPQALTKEMVGDIEEIAHSLAGNFRFTRQTHQRYSVAQHCALGAKLLSKAFGGAFLLHELSEVYLPDIASPLKPFVYVEIESSEPQSDGVKRLPWHELERQHTHTMLDALGLLSIEPLIYSPEVRAMDLAMLAAEKAALFGQEPADWGLPVPPAAVTIYTMTPDQAASEFLDLFKFYFGGI